MSERQGKPRHFSAEEKLQIIEEARAPGTSVAEVLRRHQLDGATFYGWENRAKAGMREALSVGSGGGRKPSARQREDEQKIARLEAEIVRKSRIIAEVVEENLALKKGL